MQNQNQLAVSEPTNQLLLPLPAGVKFTSRRLEMPDEMPFDQWVDVGRFLKESHGSLAFWLADYIAHGRKLYGDEKVKDTARQLAFDHSEFKNSQLLQSVALRDPDLTPKHHSILAKAKLDRVALEMWAMLAKTESLTPDELQESIKKGSVTRITPDTGAGGAGVTTWGGIRMQFDLIRRRIGNDWKTWPLEDVDATLKDLAGVLTFVMELQFRRRELVKAGTGAQAETETKAAA